MASFSPADAAIEGFRTVRQHPQVILVWGVILAVQAFVGTLVLVNMAGSALQKMTTMTAASAATVDPTEVFQFYGQILPAYLFVMLLSLASYSVLIPAALRMVIRPQDKGLAFLRIGPAELRQVAVNLIVSLILFGVYMGVAIFAVVLGVIMAPLGGTALGRVAVIGLVLVVAIAVMLFFMVKFSLAGAQTFAEGRVRIFGSWSLTGGRFWRVLGAYALAGVLALIVIFLGAVIAVVAAMAVGGGTGALSAFFKPDFSSYRTYMTPAVTIYQVVMAFIMTLVLPIMICPSARIYQAVAGTRQTEVF